MKKCVFKNPCVILNVCLIFTESRNTQVYIVFKKKRKKKKCFRLYIIGGKKPLSVIDVRCVKLSFPDCRDHTAASCGNLWYESEIGIKNKLKLYSGRILMGVWDNSTIYRCL